MMATCPFGMEVHIKERLLEDANEPIGRNAASNGDLSPLRLHSVREDLRRFVGVVAY